MTTKYSLTFNAIEDLTIGYEKIADFRKENLRAFKYAERQGWLEELTVNMRGHLPRGYMTLERCKKVAEKYQSRSEFAKQRPSIYQRARREGWLDEVCAAMPGYRSKWELDDCHKEALKHASRSDFQKACPSAYQTARINGWLNVICYHHQRRKNAQWDFLAVKNEAAKYATKSEWRVASGSSYMVAHRNGWIDEVCAHMPKHAPRKLILSEKSVRTKALEFSCKTDFRTKAKKYFNAAVRLGILENVTAHMKKSREIYTLEICRNEALKYENRGEFMRGSNGHYQKCARKGWLDLVCGHMRQINTRWTKELAFLEAKKHKTMSDFQTKSRGCYAACRRNGWLDDACNHMNYKKRVPKGHWESFENCKNAALGYSTLKSFAIECSAAYKACLRNGWLEQVSEHMPDR